MKQRFRVQFHARYSHASGRVVSYAGAASAQLAFSVMLEKASPMLGDVLGQVELGHRVGDARHPSAMSGTGDAERLNLGRRRLFGGLNILPPLDIWVLQTSPSSQEALVVVREVTSMESWG